MLDAHEMLDLFERMEERQLDKLDQDRKAADSKRASGMPRMSAVQ